MFIEYFVPAASTYANDSDNLWMLIFWFVGFWFMLCQGVFFWLMFKFKKRDGVKAQYITGELKSEKRWITIPHLLVLVCDVFIIVGAVRVWYNVKQYLPPAQETVRVIGQQWAWTFVHAGADGQIDTPDDIRTVNELRRALSSWHRTASPRKSSRRRSVRSSVRPPGKPRRSSSRSKTSTCSSASKPRPTRARRSSAPTS